MPDFGLNASAPGHVRRGRSHGTPQTPTRQATWSLVPTSLVPSPIVPTSHSPYVPGPYVPGPCFYPAANCLARSVARITALISVTRSPPSSSSRIPSIVHPAGVVTASFSSAGWYPVSSTIFAAP